MLAVEAAHVDSTFTPVTSTLGNKDIITPPILVTRLDVDTT